MRNKILLVIFTVTMMASLACNLGQSALPNLGRSVLPNLGSQGGTVTQLWQDVPKMDGMTQENIDLPLAARLAIQGYFKAASQNQGSLDFIAFTTSHTPQEIGKFYTPEKMQSAGWNSQDTGGCTISDTSSDTMGGGMCFFGKEDKSTNSGTLLAIFIAQDNTDKKQNQVFFIRIGVTNLNTPTPSQ